MALCGWGIVFCLPRAEVEFIDLTNVTQLFRQLSANGLLATSKTLLLKDCLKRCVISDLGSLCVMLLSVIRPAETKDLICT